MTPRPRHDSNTLVMLPAPLAVSNNRALTSSSPSVGPSRTSEDAPTPDSGYGPNTRPLVSPQMGDADSAESTQRLLPPSPLDIQFRQSMPPQPVSMLENMSYRPSSSLYPDSGTSTEYDEALRAGRGIQLTDGGPVPFSDGVRRVPRSQGKSQNRYSRSSFPLPLPLGAAPPQPNGGQ